MREPCLVKDQGLSRRRVIAGLPVEKALSRERG